MSRRGRSFFRKHIQEGDEAEGRVVERRRGQGRESSEGQSESEDCSLAGTPYRDLSRAAVAAKAALIKGSATRGDIRGVPAKREMGGERSESKRSEG